MAVERMRTSESVDELARKLGVRPRYHHQWRAKLEGLEPGEEAARKPTGKAAAGREAGRGFFQKCLAKSRGSTPDERRNCRDGIFEQIREVMLLQGSLSIERMCQMVPVQSQKGLSINDCNVL